MGPVTPEIVQSLLLHLPREIRDKVYDLLLEIKNLRPANVLPLLLTNKQIHDECYDVLIKKFNFVHAELINAPTIRRQLTSWKEFKAPALFIIGDSPSLAAAVSGFRGYRMHVKLPGDVAAKEVRSKLHVMLITSIQYDAFLQETARMDPTSQGLCPRSRPISIEFLHHADLTSAAKEKIEETLLSKISTYWFGFERVHVKNMVDASRATIFEEGLKKCRWTRVLDLVVEQEVAQVQGKPLFRAGRYEEALHIWWSALALVEIIQVAGGQFHQFFLGFDNAVMERHQRVLFYLNLNCAAASLRMAEDGVDPEQVTLNARRTLDGCQAALELGMGHSEEEHHVFDHANFCASSADLGKVHYRIAKAHFLMFDWPEAAVAVAAAKSYVPKDENVKRLHMAIERKLKGRLRMP